MSLSLSQHAVLLVVASAVGCVRTAFWRCTSRVKGPRKYVGSTSFRGVFATYRDQSGPVAGLDTYITYTDRKAPQQ